MAVTEPQRLALHAAARSALGDAQVDTLMALVPPANTDIATIQALDRLQMATTADIVAVRTELKTDIAAVRLEVAALRSDMLDRLDAVQWRIIGAVVLSVALSTLLDRIL